MTLVKAWLRSRCTSPASHTFAIFDAFPDESGRRAHLAGTVAEQLKARAPELFSRAPAIDQADVLAAKLPH